MIDASLEGIRTGHTYTDGLKVYGIFSRSTHELVIYNYLLQVYHVKVLTPVATWVSLKRYREFSNLHSEVSVFYTLCLHTCICVYWLHVCALDMYRWMFQSPSYSM